MKFNKKDVYFEYTRGKGPGGRHRNSTDSCVKATHIPTGISVTIDGRHQHKNKRKAIKELERRLLEIEEEKRASKKKLHRDQKIKERKIIKTYNFTRQQVKDHRTGKTAPLDEVLYKGRLDLLND